MSSNTITLAGYLFTRLRQLGCKSLHGLPGDFNLLALDYVRPAGLQWVGNCNELNAGYAADAYGRLSGLGAIMTTFGVGELSAVNAIAGSYAEVAPVVHIVGTPPRKAQESHMFLHHTLGTGDYGVYARIYSEITIAQADLTDPKTATSEIDRVLRACYVDSRPVYIQLPTDMVQVPIDAALLETAIDVTPHPSDADAEREAVETILNRLYAAKRPAILVDGGISRRRIVSEVDAFVRKLGIPVFMAALGKSTVDESLPNLVGLYLGDNSPPEIQQAVESSDLVITIGNLESDLNTGGFTFKIPQANTIALRYDNCDIGEAKFAQVYFRSLIPKLTTSFNATNLQDGAQAMPKLPQAPSQAAADAHDTITHEWLWPRMGKWFQEDDVIVTDTGTSYVGYWSSQLPKGATVINQLLWSSIGFGVGATQGAGLAAADEGNGRRTICFEGDGSFQLTAQEIATMIHHNLDVTMFLIENNGYTIERYVHGLEAYYNDIPQWKYASLPDALTPANSLNKAKTWKIATRSELETLLQDADFARGKGVQFVELHMPKLDAPQALIDFGVNAAKRAS